MFEPATPAVERATLEPSMFDPVTPAAPANRPNRATRATRTITERATLEPAAVPVEKVASVTAPEAAPETAPPARKGRAPRQPAAKKTAPAALSFDVAPAPAPAPAPVSFDVAPAEAKPKAPARSRRPRKTSVDAE
jgi:hypothetical protein